MCYVFTISNPITIQKKFSYRILCLLFCQLWPIEPLQFHHIRQSFLKGELMKFKYRILCLLFSTIGFYVFYFSTLVLRAGQCSHRRADLLKGSPVVSKTLTLGRHIKQGAFKLILWHLI